MPAGANLRYWIDLALECIRRDHTPGRGAGEQAGPCLSARALGMALAALHDGNAMAFGVAPLLPVSTGHVPTGSNPVIAGAAACHQLLTLRYPHQARYLQPAWARWLELHDFASTGSGTETAGRALGSAIDAFGAKDAMLGKTNTYMATGAPYTHDCPPTDPGQGFYGSDWGRASRLRARQVQNFPPPPGRVSPTAVVPSPDYAADHAEVAQKGVQRRALGTRTAQEEVTGIYWGYDGPAELGTPPRLYLQVLLAILDNVEIAKPGALTLNDELKIAAAAAVAMADAGIEAWHYKYAGTHMMWRPALGIPRALAGNGVPDPAWEPLGRPDTNGNTLRRTPNFPAYPSGHATFGAAAFQLLRLFLVEKGLATFDPKGVDDVRFGFVSDEFNGRNTDPRTGEPRDLLTLEYESLWAATVANSLSRVYLGVHWQFDGITKRGPAGGDSFGIPRSPAELGRTGGVWLGAQVANDLALAIGVTAGTIAASKM